MKRPRPDLRPSWQDPDLPVFGKSGKAINPEKMVLKAQMTLVTSQAPNWKNDPTYELRKRK